MILTAFVPSGSVHPDRQASTPFSVSVGQYEWFDGASAVLKKATIYLVLVLCSDAYLVLLDYSRRYET